jgi:hypothetical protein
MGAVNTTYTFTATDTITSTKMNNIIDETTITTDAIIGTTLEVASGKLKIRSAGITTNELGAGSVTSNAIADGTIVNADISASADIAGSKLADNSTSGVKLTDASVTPAKLAQPLTLVASQSASGTSVDFTGIPTWTKRVTVMLNGVSTNGTSSVLIQLGAGSITSTGYLSGSSVLSSAVATVNNTSGFQINLGGSDTSAAIRSGSMILNSVEGNTWSTQGVFATSNVATTSITAGLVPLSGDLDRVRITTVGGVNTFDAGSISISYE